MRTARDSPSGPWAGAVLEVETAEAAPRRSRLRATAEPWRPPAPLQASAPPPRSLVPGAAGSRLSAAAEPWGAPTPPPPAASRAAGEPWGPRPPPPARVEPRQVFSPKRPVREPDGGLVVFFMDINEAAVLLPGPMFVPVLGPRTGAGDAALACGPIRAPGETGAAAERRHSRLRAVLAGLGGAEDPPGLTPEEARFRRLCQTLPLGVRPAAVELLRAARLAGDPGPNVWAKYAR